jgi:hypothetical protein
LTKDIRVDSFHLLLFSPSRENTPLPNYLKLNLIIDY